MKNSILRSPNLVISLYNSHKLLCLHIFYNFIFSRFSSFDLKENNLTGNRTMNMYLSYV